MFQKWTATLKRIHFRCKLDHYLMQTIDINPLQVEIQHIHLFLQCGSNPMGETLGSLAVIDK